MALIENIVMGPVEAPAPSAAMMSADVQSVEGIDSAKLADAIMLLAEKLGGDKADAVTGDAVQEAVSQPAGSQPEEPTPTDKAAKSDGKKA